MMAGRLLVPVTGGYDVFDPATGAAIATSRCERPPSADAVVPAVAGSTLLEQRGGELVASALAVCVLSRSDLRDARRPA